MRIFLFYNAFIKVPIGTSNISNVTVKYIWSKKSYKKILVILKIA